MKRPRRVHFNGKTALVILGAGVLAASRGRGSGSSAAAPDAAAWSLHLQSTAIDQWHGPFRSPYQGSNSLDPEHEDQHTFTATGFLGRALWPGTELYYNPEASAGSGLSGTLGIAGFPNGEGTRASGASPKYNTARLFLRETINLGGEQEEVASGLNQMAGHHDIDRVTLTAGKFGVTDIFDGNRYSHDPRSQFLNWALMDNGAWDFPADAKGYTDGISVEWNEPTTTLRWGAFLEPAEANGRSLQTDPARAWGQVLEFEQRYRLAGRPGALRPLVYANRAHMGNYAEATALPRPDVTLTRRDRSKVGAGVSWDQEISDQVGAFARAGWNDGRNESWAFTEIDRTLSAGLSFSGARWHRTQDGLGVAGVVNGLSPWHRRYLEAGGVGFIVGDGRLSYGPEQIVETYYNWRVFPWFSLTFDWQLVSHPAYNRDRGPVSVLAVRGHLER